MIERRLDEIESAIRREFPALPDGARFVATQTDAGSGTKSGMEFPIPEGVMFAILVPNPKWPDRQPQYRRVARWRSAEQFAHYEKQHGRIVGAPDVALTDFRSAAREAVTLYQNMRELQ